MAIADDWTINYTAKTITHSSGTTVYTVNAFYSWLMDVFDDASQMDDLVPMSANNASEYNFINGWTFGAPTTDINFLKSGAITNGDGTIWANLYTIGSDAVISGITLYVVQGTTVLTFSQYSAGHMDVLVKVNNAGTPINASKVTVFAREWGYTFDHYEIDFSTNIVQPAPVAVESDLSNTTAVGTVEAYNIGVTFGTYTVDVSGDGIDENYEIELDLNSTHTVAEAYEYLKAITRRGETTVYDGQQGQMYLSANPGTYAEVKKAPFGTFGGGKLFGARGLHLKLAERPASEANKYELIDSDNNAEITEPVSVSVEVTSVVVGDRVLVALDDGAGDVDKDQFTTAASGNGAGSSTVTITTTIPQETPSAGAIRINGKRYTYSSRSGSVFTLNATDWPTGLEEANNSVDCYVPWIDEAATGTSISVSITAPAANKTVVIRVRKYGGAGSSIVPFESPGTINSASGMSVGAIRTADNVVT